MNRRSLITISAATALGLTLQAGNAVAQQKSLKEQLVGTWSMVSNITTRSDGTKTDTFGPNPKAMVVYESNGRVGLSHHAIRLTKIFIKQPFDGNRR